MVTKTFQDVYETLPADGWLSEAEAQLLWELMQQTEGPILEVGCYKGRSTCLLASTGRPVYAVDPFSGFSTEDPTGATIEAILIENLTARRLGNVDVFPIKIDDWTPRPVGLAYLDGDHTYEGTLRQLAAAKACQAKIIAIHDVNDSGGGQTIRDAALKAIGPWNERVERLAWWEVPDAR